MRSQKQSAEKDREERIIMQEKKESELTKSEINSHNMQQAQRQRKDISIKPILKGVANLIDNKFIGYESSQYIVEGEMLDNQINFSQKQQIVKTNQEFNVRVPSQEEEKNTQISEKKLNSSQFEQPQTNNQSQISKEHQNRYETHGLSSKEIRQITKDVSCINTVNSDDLAQSNKISPIKSLLQPCVKGFQIKTKIATQIMFQRNQATITAKSFPIRRPQLYSYYPFLSEAIQILPFYYPLYKQKIPKKDQIVKVQKLEINAISQSSEKQNQIEFTMNFRKQPLDISDYLKNTPVNIEGLTQTPINRRKFQKYQFLTTVSKPIHPGKQQQVSITQEQYQQNIEQQLKMVKNIFSYRQKDSASKINQQWSGDGKISFLNYQMHKPKLILRQQNQPKREYNYELIQSGNSYQFPYSRWSYPQVIKQKKIDFNVQSPINNAFPLIPLNFEGLSDRQNIQQQNSQKKVKIQLCSPRAQKKSYKKDTNETNKNTGFKLSVQENRMTEDKRLVIQLYQKIAKQTSELQKKQIEASPVRKQRMKITQIVKNPVENKATKQQQSPYKIFFQNNVPKNSCKQSLDQHKTKVKMFITLKNKNIHSPQTSHDQSYIQNEYEFDEKPIQTRIN